MKILLETYKQFMKYRDYFFYNVKSTLKSNLQGSYLGYLWWLLDPLMFMLVYIFVVVIVFDQGKPNFPVFVFVGLLSWKWTATTINQSADSIKGRAALLKQIYLPKFLLPLVSVSVNSIYFIFGLVILAVMIPLYSIPITIHIFEFFIVFIVQGLLLFGIGLIMSHVGVFVSDLKNVLTFTIRFWFYVSPIMYSIEDIPEKLRGIYNINPMVCIIEGYRNVVMYGKSPDYSILTIWGIISLLLIIYGLNLFKKYDRNYTKVI